MPDLAHTPEDLRQLYRTRFGGNAEYRTLMWGALTRYFERWISADATVLDLGCGYGEFINHVHCQTKFAMDLNPDSVRFVKTATVFEQDCSQPWPFDANRLDIVFTSNFFEHLPTKAMLESTLVEAFRALKPGGCLIAMGPNVRYVSGAYWDFFDHHLALTERSLTEVLLKVGFETESCFDKFMPYSTVGRRRYPVFVIRTYLAIPLAWKLFGKQFLIVARKPLIS